MTNRDFKAEFISHFQNCPNDPVWSSGLQKGYSSKNARIHKWIIDTACLILEFYNSIPSNSLPSERCDNVTSMFYETQHAIAQNEAFWLVAGYFWRESGSNDPRWSSIFESNNRLNVHRDIRSQYMTLGSSSGEYIIARNATLSYIPSYFKRKSKKFRVYRAFWVSNDEKIRSTNDKSDVKFYEQSAGSGLSYSLSKTYPIFMIGAKFSVEYLRRYSTLPEHEFLQLSDQRTLGPSLTHVLARKAASLNQRPIIGTYEIDKSDVVALLANDEEEVLTLKKPKFLRYDPITYADAFASELLVMYNRDQQSTNIAKYKLNPSETPVSYLHKLRVKISYEQS